MLDNAHIYDLILKYSIFGVLQLQILRARLVCVFKNWKLLFKNIYGNTCGWKSVLKCVKCCLKTENGCLKTQTKHPLKLLRLLYWNRILEFILFKMYHDIIFFFPKNLPSISFSFPHTRRGYFANSFEIIFIFFKTYL